MQGHRPIGKLSPSTLVYTVGAVVMSLPSIKEDVPHIHKALMSEYPEYAEAEIELVMQDPKDPNQARKQNILHFALNSPKKDWGVLLTTDRILLQTTSYIGFSDFASRFSNVLTVIQSKTGLAYYKGLGFRHIDNISPLRDGAEMSSAINQQFLTPKIAGALSTHFSKHDYIYTLDDMKLVFKLYNFDHGHAPSLPKDIFTNYISLKGVPNLKLVDRPFALADFEASNFREDADMQPFEIEKMMESLDQLHQFTSISYRELMNPSELKARGCNNVD